MKKLLIPLLGGLLFLTACNNSTDDKKETSMKEPVIKTEALTYSAENSKDSL